MPSAGVWARFDFRFRILRLAVTRGQSSAAGVITPSTYAAAVEIFGHLILDPLQEQFRDRSGIIVPGDAIFYTDTALQRGDIVRVSLDATNAVTHDFEVVAAPDNKRTLINEHTSTPDRSSFILRRKQTKVP